MSKLIQRIWTALWACKAALFSVLAGVVLLARFQEARDLFHDRMGPGGLMEYVLLVFVVWRLPLPLDWAEQRIALGFS